MFSPPISLRLVVGKISFLLLILLSNLYSSGQNINLSNGNVFDGEPYIAVDPNDSQHLVVAWMGWVNIANQFQIKTRASFDGGLSWSPTYIFPHTVTGYSSADPSIAFHPSGDVFVCHIDFTGTTPPVTGGVYLRRSTDGGISWGNPLEVINTNYDGTKWPIDRPWISIDNSQTANSGTIYVTTMNLNRTNPSFRPYLSVSMDQGNTFTTHYVDSTGYLAGSLNPLPMCTHTVTSTGIWYGMYPSYVLSQSFYAQNILAASSNGGISYSYNTAYTITDTIPSSNFPSAKKAALLLNNPADPDHLAFVFLRTFHGDLDVFWSETFNGGSSWSSPERVNDDPIGNDRMQDLLWGDFDEDGDLVIGWRDRRNASNGTFQTPSEIWAAFRDKDSLNFNPNFPITSQPVPYDSVLEYAGNDFMSLQLSNDTLYTVWGDVQSGDLNIWFHSRSTDGTVLSAYHLNSEPRPSATIYPNPFLSSVTVKAPQIGKVSIYDSKGSRVFFEDYDQSIDQVELELSHLRPGKYLMEINQSERKVVHKILKLADH